MKLKIELLPPMMPNYLPVKSKPRPRQEGFKDDEKRVPVEDLTDEQAVEYGELMKQAFIEHHAQRKAKPPKCQGGLPHN